MTPNKSIFIRCVSTVVNSSHSEVTSLRRRGQKLHEKTVFIITFTAQKINVSVEVLLISLSE